MKSVHFVADLIKFHRHSEIGHRWCGNLTADTDRPRTIGHNKTWHKHHPGECRDGAAISAGGEISIRCPGPDSNKPRSASSCKHFPATRQMVITLQTFRFASSIIYGLVRQLFPRPYSCLLFSLPPITIFNIAVLWLKIDTQYPIPPGLGVFMMLGWT